MVKINENFDKLEVKFSFSCSPKKLLAGLGAGVVSLYVCFG